MVIYHIFIPAGRDEHECGCFLCADSSRVDGVSCCYEHGVFERHTISHPENTNAQIFVGVVFNVLFHLYGFYSGSGCM